MTKTYQLRDKKMVDEILAREPMSITGWELMRIAAWKNAYIPAALSVANLKHLESTLARLLSKLADYKDVDVVADAQRLDWDKWESDVHWMFNSTGLWDVSGIRYSFATGILGYLMPHAFPVLDRLTVGGIFGWEVAKTPSRWCKTPVYRSYAEQLAKFKLESWQSKNVHERDQDLMRTMKALEGDQGKCPIPGLMINLPGA